jgi:ABC-2 type transport system permease protein
MNRWPIVRALVRKDLTLFFRNRFFAYITLLGLVFYIIIYFVMPKAVDETLELGVYSAALPEAVLELLDAEEVGYQVFESDDALRAAILDGDVPAGLVFPPDLMVQLRAGQKPRVDVYLAAGSPPEVRDVYVAVVKGMALALSGQPLNIEANEITLGPDMAGQQIAPRDRMRPLLAVIIIVMETMGLATLIAEEVQGGTLRALLITPMDVRDLFVGKGIMGVGMTFIQAVLVMGVTGGLCQSPVLMLVALLLGALMATSIGFLMASVSRDMMSSIGWGIVAMVVMSIPAFGVLFPGTVSTWGKALPSYYLIDTIHRVANFAAGWAEVWPNLLILAGINGLFLWIGVTALRRRFS